MNKSLLVVFSMAASLSITVYAQPVKAPAEVVQDGFSDAASAFLKKHPEVEKCADKMADANRKERRKQGLEERTTYAEYGEFIGICAKKPNSTAKQVTGP